MKGSGEMARKESITKDVILSAAFAILEEEGISQVTARKLAARANCSTQPIFRIYRNMEELTQELFTRAVDFFQEYYGKFARQTVTPFVHLGSIYIRFAADYKRLFSFIFLSENRFGKSMYDIINGDAGWVGCEMQMASGQGCKNAGELFTKMWIIIHGAACMSLTGDFDLSQEETARMLKDSYRAFKG